MDCVARFGQGKLMRIGNNVIACKQQLACRLAVDTRGPCGATAELAGVLKDRSQCLDSIVGLLLWRSLGAIVRHKGLGADSGEAECGCRRVRHVTMCWVDC